MTKKDFFRIIIKVFGLYFLVTFLFSVLPSNIAFVLIDLGWFEIIWLLAVVLIFALLFILLILKPDKIIGWLKLEKGFDEKRIQFEKFNSENIIKLS